MHTLAAAMFFNRGEVRLKSYSALVLHVTVPCSPMRQLWQNTDLHLFCQIYVTSPWLDASSPVP